jgi:hydrogenase small subunit
LIASHAQATSTTHRNALYNATSPDPDTDANGAAPAPGEGEQPVHVLWLNAALSCDGDSVAFTAATQPSVEAIVAGLVPGVPPLRLHWPLLASECGPSGGEDDFLAWFFRAARGELERFVLVVEGSVPDDSLAGDGYWAAFGNDPETGDPIRTCEWLDRLAPRALTVVAVGTCAAYGGVHAMAGNPTGARGVPDYLGWDWRSRAGIPVVCVPGCPVQPDSLAETLVYVLRQLAGREPAIPLDESLRPEWIFARTVHESCDRGGYYEQGQFASGYGEQSCLVRQGCWGPVVRCPVPARGWINGVGGCPNVGGICIGCTMPGFPDKFLPFMAEPPSAAISTAGASVYGSLVRRLRSITLREMEREPSWRGRPPADGPEPGVAG